MLSEIATTLLGDKTQSVACILAGVVAAIVVVSKLSASPKLDAFPTVGPTRWPGPYEEDCTKLIHEGYAKYKNRPFKISFRSSWVVVLGDRKHIQEAENAREDSVKFHDGLRMHYTTGAVEMPSSISHAIVSRLTRNIGSLFDEVRDEIITGFDEVLALKDEEWKCIPAVDTVFQVVSRTTNRAFVGLPLCRNPEWISLSVQYTLNIAHGASKIRFVPDFLASLVLKYRSEIPRNVELGMRLLAPVIQERRKLMKEHGDDWTGKPNDALSWMLDMEPNDTLRFTTLRLLSMNFAAIHTTSMTFSHVLLHLAQYPEYIQPLRDEVESIVAKEGWSKASVGKMQKVDSFVRECQRMAGIGTTTATCKVAKELTLSDGTVLPKGVFVVGPAREFHYDDEVYPNAHEFNPFRFSDMRNEDGEVAAKYQFTFANGVDHWLFGHGKHACPGRFFAASEVKTILAHVVTSYDVKLDDGNVGPQNFIVGAAVAPNPMSKIMIRRRVL